MVVLQSSPWVQVHRGSPFFHSRLEGEIFFVYFDLPWGFNWIRGDPRLFLNREKSILPRDKEDFNKFMGMEVPKLSELLDERALYNVGLSPAPP